MKSRRQDIKWNIRMFSMLYLVLVAVPIMISLLACLLCWKQLGRETARFAASSMENASGAIDAKLSALEIMVNQIAFDDDIYAFCPVQDPMALSERYKVSQIMRSLSVYGLPNEYVKLLYVYYPNSNYIITPGAAYTSDYFFTHLVQFGTTGNVAEAEQFHARVYDMQYRTGGSTVLYEGSDRFNVSMLIRSIPRPRGGNANIVALIDNRLFENALENIDPEWVSAVLDREGRAVVLRGWEAEQLPQQGQMTLPKGSLRMRMKDGNYSITYSASANGMFKYIVAAPEKALYQEIFLIIRMIFIILALLLGAGSYVVFRASWSISEFMSFIFDAFSTDEERKRQINYQRLRSQVSQSFWRETTLKSHVKELMEENSAYKQQAQNNHSAVQNALLLKLVRGDTGEYRNEAGIYQHYGLNFPYDAFRVLLIEMLYSDRDPLQKKVEVFGTLQFLLRSLLEEKEGGWTGYLCDVDTERILILLNLSSSGEEAVAEGFAKRICSFIERNSETACAIGVSGSCSNVERLNDYFRQALKCLDYRTINSDENSIIYYERIKNRRQSCGYSIHRELNMIHYLKEGQIEECMGEVERFLEKSAGEAETNLLAMRHMFFDILSTAFSVADELKIPLDTVGETDTIVNGILNGKSVEEMRGILYDVFVEITSYAGRAKTSGNSELGQKIIAYIDANYLNYDFSQLAVADQFQLSPSALSQFFKEFAGLNLSDYVKEKRLQKARELLSETGLSLQEIAGKVGYASEHTLIRLFKQRYGVTPGKYRQMEAPKE
ncbi:MAG: helix-turn-helix transcriptional regulator [Provencibacterium sp.]|nr:helix-turn-helix transcriptional regulator [Provencibacterium sp.]